MCAHLSKKGVVHVYVCDLRGNLLVNAYVCFGTGTQAVCRHTHVQEAYL